MINFVFAISIFFYYLCQISVRDILIILKIESNDFHTFQDPSRGTHEFGLTLVGHSLGAGTAAILAILMRQDYPDLVCFSYAPPGGLLSMPAQEYTQEFITSVVVGKDVIPRIGLRQMESLRADLINAIKRSVDPKVFDNNIFNFFFKTVL